MTTSAEGGASAQAVIRVWLEGVLQQMRWTPHKLAKESGVGAATLSRALDRESTFVTSNRTIEKIVRTTGIAAPTGIGAGNSVLSGIRVHAGGMAESEAVYIVNPSEEVAEPLRVTGQQAIWQIRGRSIDLAGYLPGDYLLVDPTVRPRLRDVVCVQVLTAGAAETVFRVFDPPFAMTETSDPVARRKPLTIDDQTASIWGVVVRALRIRED